MDPRQRSARPACDACATNQRLNTAIKLVGSDHSHARDASGDPTRWRFQLQKRAAIIRPKGNEIARRRSRVERISDGIGSGRKTVRYRRRRRGRRGRRRAARMNGGGGLQTKRWRRRRWRRFPKVRVELESRPFGLGQGGPNSFFWGP
jgi:hypothetical protein